MDWNAVIARYEAELLERVVPFWETHAPDRERGGFFTCLDRDGAVYDDNKYMWMQWRIVYMFAALYKSEYGAGRDDWLQLAKDGFDWLVRHGRTDDGSYYFQLDRGGVPVVAPCNIFSDCFAAMGAAALFAATGDDRHRAEAESAMASYVRRLDNPKGRWTKTLPGARARRSLGGYMILANLAEVMRECLGSDQYENDAREAVRRVTTEFWHPDMKIIFENVDRDGGFDLASTDGRLISPGHGLESTWFLLAYARRTGDAALEKRLCAMVDGQFTFGWDREHGGLYYFMDALGKPPMALEHDMKLWWVHNEACLAALYAYRASGDAHFVEMFRKVDAWSFDHFRDPEHGEWYGYLGRRGDVSIRAKGGKWKTFFHLPRYLLLAIRIMRELAPST